MRALTWQGNLDVRVTDVPDPRIQEPNDAIIAVTTTAICGSDLHLYGVLGPYLWGRIPAIVATLATDGWDRIGFNE
jgi:D-arabinose 1-dehydrogenase-like Zn-dependent alcohol dehydrogenase